MSAPAEEDLKPIALALGSNLGPARETFEQACAGLEQHGVHVLRRSRLYQSRPWGVIDQPPFTNAAILVTTSLTPIELLRSCLAVERELGRERKAKWGPRLIDLDVLFYGSIHLESEELTLPHPWLTRRDFVLAPLCDLKIAPPPGSGLPDFETALAELPEAECVIIGQSAWD